MLSIQLWAYTPGSDAVTVLPQPLSWQASFVLSDIGSLSITYPISAVGHAILDGYCDVEVRYWDGTEWMCPAQGRFSVVDRNVDPVSERNQPSRSYTCQSYGWLARRVYQEVTTGLDASGNRPFAGRSVGEVATILINEAHTRGGVPNLAVQNLSGTGGSSPAYPPGKALYDILSDARDQGLCEWMVVETVSTGGQGRALSTFTPPGGVDQSTGDNPVILREGVDVVQAPSTVSIADLAGRVLVAGDSGRFLGLDNPGADTPYGILSTYVTAGGLTDAAALQIVGQAALDKGRKPRAQHTRAIRFESAKFLPFEDYNLGDLIQAPDESGKLAAMRVRQITLTSDQNGLAGNLVLGDRFTEASLLLDRKVSQLTGGANAISGAGRPPSPASDDKRQPAAPTGFNVGSTPYTDPDGHYKALASFGWVNPTEATDGSAMDPASVQVYGRKGTSGTFGRVTSADFPATSVQWSPFDAGAVYQFKLRAVSSNGKLGPFGSTVQTTMARDTTPPPVPSAASWVSRGGTALITWDGTGSAGEVMPADFDHTEVHVSASAGFTPSKSTLIGVIGAPGVVALPNLPYNSTRYVKLISVDRAGNKSAASAQTTGTVKAIVDTDIIGQIIAGANIKDGTINAADKVIANTITSALIQAKAIKAGHLDVNSVTASAIAAGSLDGFLITGAVIQTSASFPKLQLNNNGISYFVDSSHALFQISISDGRVLFRSSSSTSTGFSIDTNSGISLYNGSGARTLFLNAATGGITMSGPLITSGTITGAVVQTATSGARAYMSGDDLATINADGDYVFRTSATGGSDGKGFINFQTSASGARVYFTNNGLRLYNGSGTQTFYLNANDGSINMTGPLVSGGTITGATIQTDTSGARVYMNSGGINMVNSGGDFLFQVTQSGYFLLRNKVSGARIYFASDYGLAAFNSSGTRTVYIGNDGSASFSGTVTASNINTTTINGATFTGTQSGGTFSGMTQSGGSWTGSIGASGVTATGGVFRTSSASTRIELNGPASAIRFYLTGTLVASLTAGGNGINIGGTGNLTVGGNLFAQSIYSSVTSDSPNVVVGPVGLLYRGTSSKRYKADIKPAALDKTVLKLQPVTFRSRKDTSKLSPLLGADKIAAIQKWRTEQQSRRYLGVLAEDVDALGMTELVTYDDQKRPDAVAYDRLAVPLIPIIAEHDSRLDALSAELAALTEKYAALTGASS